MKDFQNNPERQKNLFGAREERERLDKLYSVIENCIRKPAMELGRGIWNMHIDGVRTGKVSLRQNSRR